MVHSGSLEFDSWRPAAKGSTTSSLIASDLGYKIRIFIPELSVSFTGSAVATSPFVLIAAAKRLNFYWCAFTPIGSFRLVLLIFNERSRSEGMYPCELLCDSRSFILTRARAELRGVRWLMFAIFVVTEVFPLFLLARLEFYL